MMHYFHTYMAPLIAAYGSLGVALLVALESLGLPLPGEAALISAAIYAGTTHKIDIYILIGCAAAGAILGGVAGYWIGRSAGYRLALRHGGRIGLTERRLAVGQYLFQRHGGKILFLGRFVAILRTVVAILAGINTMDWRRFLAVTAAAAILWAGLYGGAAYVFGKQIDRMAGPAGIAIIAVVVIGMVGASFLLHRHGRKLEEHVASQRPLGSK
ncbi:MAG TPA: DedA family protein [Acetobacteraceae bacterium]|nr:DedA family protein [Acetobacteraceae bacterium]